MNILNELNSIFVDYFDDDSLTLTHSTTASDIEEWDSLAQVGLLVMIEKKFKLEFTVQEVSELNNIGDMCELISLRLEI